MKRIHNLRPKISSNITLLPCLTDAVYGRDYSDTDTDDKNSPDVIQIVLFFYPETNVTRRRGLGA